MTRQEFIDIIAKNAPKCQWLSYTVVIEGKGVGVKAFGKWVQRLECNGLKTTVEECKTLKEFKLKVAEALDGVMR